MDAQSLIDALKILLTNPIRFADTHYYVAPQLASCTLKSLLFDTLTFLPKEEILYELVTLLIRYQLIKREFLVLMAKMVMWNININDFNQHAALRYLGLAAWCIVTRTWNVPLFIKTYWSRELQQDERRMFHLSRKIFTQMQFHVERQDRFINLDIVKNHKRLICTPFTTISERDLLAAFDCFDSIRKQKFKNIKHSELIMIKSISYRRNTPLDLNSLVYFLVFFFFLSSVTCILALDGLLRVHFMIRF